MDRVSRDSQGRFRADAAVPRRRVRHSVTIASRRRRGIAGAPMESREREHGASCEGAGMCPVPRRSCSGLTRRSRLCTPPSGPGRVGACLSFAVSSGLPPAAASTGCPGAAGRARSSGSLAADLGLNEDYRDLLVYLADSGADFLLIGGWALALHGRVERTSSSVPNPRTPNAFRALIAFGAPVGRARQVSRRCSGSKRIPTKGEPARHASCHATSAGRVHGISTAFGALLICRRRWRAGTDILAG